MNSVGDRDLAKLVPRGDVGVAKLRTPTCAEFTYAVNLNAHKPHNLILRTIYFLYGMSKIKGRVTCKKSKKFLFL